MPQGEKMSGQIFISYRREDSAAWAGRLSDRLKSYLPSAQIFMDVDTIEPGVDFVQAVENIVSACDVLIAVIGSRWLTSSDRRGGRRLDTPGDLVRLEIATALKRGIRVVPVLVEGAKMPEAGELPDDLKALVRRNALEIGHTRFNADSEHLVIAVQRALGKTAEQSELEKKDRLDPDLPQRKEQERSGTERHKTEAKERLEAADRQKKEQRHIASQSQVPLPSLAAAPVFSGKRKLRRISAVMMLLTLVVGLAVIAAIYLSSHPPKLAESGAVLSDSKPVPPAAVANPTGSISAKLDSKQTDLLSELKEAPDGVLRVRTNEDGSFKSLVVKATVEIEDVLGAQKGKQIARKEAEIQCKKHLGQWLNENCVFVGAANDSVSIQTKGESAKDAAGNTVKVRSRQGQESKLLTKSSASLAEATLQGLFVVSSEAENTQLVLIMALTQKTLGQSDAVSKTLTGRPANSEKTGLPKASGDNDRPAPESKVNRDILNDLE
jgi:hypothetical protein